MTQTATDIAPPPKWKQVLDRLGVTALLGTYCLIVPPLGTLVLAWQINRVELWLNSHGAMGPIVFLLVGTICCSFAMLPFYATAALAGYAFGFWTGLPVVMVAFSFGVSIVYWISRRTGGKRVVQMVEESPKWSRVYHGLLTDSKWRTFFIVALLRLPPNSPFSFTNFVLGTLKVRFSTALIGSVTGLLPRTAIVVYLGGQAKELSLEESGGWVAFGISVVISLLVLGVIGAIANRYLRAQGGGQRAESQPQTP